MRGRLWEPGQTRPLVPTFYVGMPSGRSASQSLQLLFQVGGVFFGNGGIYAHTGPDFKSGVSGQARLDLEIPMQLRFVGFVLGSRVDYIVVIRIV